MCNQLVLAQQGLAQPGLAKEQLSSYVADSGQFDEITQKVKLLPSLSADEFPRKVQGLRVEIEKFISRQDLICNGQFYTFEMEEGDGKKRKKKRLSYKERVLCFKSLKDFQKVFIENMHLAQKKYLSYLHTKRLGELDDYREKLLAELDSYGKTRSRKRKSKK